VLDTQQTGASAPLASGPVLVIDDTILELLPAAVCVCDADGVIVRYNPKAAELWGRWPRRGDSGERFCGSHRLFWPDGRPLPHRETPMADVLRTGEPARNLEVLIEQASGSRICVLASIEPIKNEAGEITGAINCFQDITARKRIEEKVRGSQELLRAVVATAPECVKIVAYDGELLHMNPAGLEMVEADGAGAVEGGCIFDLIAPEHRGLWRDNHERVCNGEKLSWEFDVVGLRGTRRQVETYAAPLRMPDGTLAQLAVTHDVTERKRFEAALRDGKQRLLELLEALPAAVYTTDAAGRITFYNQAAVDLWGHEPELGESEWCGSWRLRWPDGAPMPHEQCPMAVALKENRPIRDAEAVAERPDGTRVPFAAYPTPLRDASGALVGAVNMLVDITHHKQAEQRQQWLINELNHRVKNTLATVQSIAAQSFGGAAESQAHRWFEGRLLALSNAHDVLTRENWQGANLRDIVAQAVAPLCGQDKNRFEISGSDLRLPPKMALSLAMAIHELCTNAAKYGALSDAAGSVTVGWRVVPVGERRRLCLRWAERGGPRVDLPRRKGFGSRLIERGLAHELGAEVRLEYAPSGVVCEIDAPLP
jgi:PAS domain S-box-containing protein